MAAEHDFSLRVALTAIYKGFRQSPDAGWDAVRNTRKDIDSIGKSDFITPIQIRVDSKTGERDLFWDGYDRSIADSMRRYVAFLKVTGAPAAKIKQAKAEWRMWNELQDIVLNLEAGESVEFLALRGLNPEDGVALQQISWQDGRLVLESQLLPFDQITQIDKFVGLMADSRQKLDLDMDTNGLSSLLGWVVRGKALDFNKELPELMERVVQPVGRELMIDRPIEIVPQKIWWVRPELNLLIPELMPHKDSNDVHLGGAREVDERVGFWWMMREGTGGEVVTESNVSQPHFGSGVAEPVVESVVMGAMEEVLGGQIAERKSVIGVKVTEEQKGLKAVVTEMEAPVYGEISVSRDVSFGGQAEVTEVTTTELPIYEEITVSRLVDGVEKGVEAEVIIAGQTEVMTEGTESLMIEEVSNGETVGLGVEQTEVGTEVKEGTEKILVVSDSLVLPVIEETFVDQVEERGGIAEIGDVHLGGVHETDRMEEPSAECTEFTEGTEVVVFNAFSDYVSAPSVIKEIFDKTVIQHKSIKSVREKLVWLSRNIANVVADGLIGRWLKSNKKDKSILGWLVHGLAMMQFDRVEKKRFDGVLRGTVSRWRLSPVRVWADRVIQAMGKTKQKFMQAGLGVYKHIFATF